MLNNIKTRILKYCDLSWKDLTQLKTWMHFSRSFNSFDVETFTAPSLRVAVATNADGDTVCIAPIEKVCLVRAFATNPEATPTEAQRAGDAIDTEIEREAQRNGISRCLILVPADHPRLPNEKSIRVVERKIRNTITTHGVGCSTSPNAAHYLN